MQPTMLKLPLHAPTHEAICDIQEGYPTGRRGDEIALPATQPDLGPHTQTRRIC
jgi:hypothetical protein